MELIKVSQLAKEKLLNIINDKPSILLKLTKYGCSGKGYKFELLDKDLKSEDFITLEGNNGKKKLFIESISFLNLIGCEIDYKINELEEGFIFNNPNAKSTCGCGKSFN